MPAVFSELHPCFIDGNLDNPGAEFRFEPEILQGIEGLEHGLLGDFLCISRILQNPFGREIDRTLVGPHELVKSLVLSGANSLNEFRFTVVSLSAVGYHRRIIRKRNATNCDG